MKHIFLSVCCGMLVLVSGCDPSPCNTEFECVNGECLEGECACDSLYEGLTCSVLQTSKFLGTWTAGDLCSSGTEVYELTTEEAATPGRIRFNALGPDRLPVFAEVDGLLLRIYDQAYGLAVIGGEGGIDTSSQVITLDFIVDYGQGNSVNCLTSLEN